MNPIHYQFVKNPPHNQYEDLFAVVDALESKKRDEAMMPVFMDFVKMELAPETHPAETFGERMTDYTNYNRFKRECLSLPASLDPAFIINGVVHRTLSYLFSRAEMDREETVKAHRGILARAEEAIKELTDQRQIESFRHCMKMSEDKISGIDKEIDEAKELYAYICYNLAQPLMARWEETKRNMTGDSLR